MVDLKCEENIQKVLQAEQSSGQLVFDINDYTDIFEAFFFILSRYKVRRPHRIALGKIEYEIRSFDFLESSFFVNVDGATIEFSYGSIMFVYEETYRFGFVNTNVTFIWPPKC